MDISISPIKLGLTVDLGNYGNNPKERGEYVKWFAEDTSGDGPKMLHVYTTDRHIHSQPGIFTLDDKARLENELGKFALFLNKFPQIDLVSFQFPYNQLPPELQVVNNLDGLYNSKDNNPQREKLLEGGKIIDVERANEMVMTFLSVLSETDFNSLKYYPVVLFHAGGILPYDLIREEKGDVDRFINLRRKLLNDQLSYHKLLLNEFNEKKVVIGLENIPIWDGVFHDPRDINKRNNQLYQWLSEHAFEDFESRLVLEGVHNIDIPHVAMNSAYYSQHMEEFFSMEMLRKEFSGIPFSLRSIRDYIKIVSNFFEQKGKSMDRIIYHIADCNGIWGDNEGVPIGIENSIIDWRDVIDAIRQYTPNSYGAIEIQHGHLKENYDTYIRQSLKKFLSFCR